ncbi:hypothetical protein BAQ49_03850 [Bacillus proteolyticus]|uniref:Uncharacterized protein n=1 Tax=Bacillus proteolyticus TaxID=2026192 RepID=A0AA44KQG9_9BACI|nr:hypothetical protein BAQ49_03850 [Bacillus proteolyticus]
MFYGSMRFFIHSYPGAVLEFLFVIRLAEKLYKILHALNVGFFQNAGGNPVYFYKKNSVFSFYGYIFLA